MPTVDKRNLFKSGGSTVVALPTGFIKYLKKLTGKDNPEVEVYGDTILIVKPTDVTLDETTINSVKKLLYDIEKMDKMENMKNDKR